MSGSFLSGTFRLKTEIFDVLSPAESNALLNSVYRKGEIIFREGGIPTGIYHIRSGRVKKFKSTPKGGEQILYVCSDGELLGYQAILGEELFPDSTAALVESEITFISKEAFLRVLAGSPSLSNRLLKALGREFSLFIKNFTQLATKNVRERLAFNLLALDEKFRVPGKNHHSDIRMSRTDLANMTSTAKETLVRLLREFKQKKLIQTTRTSILILDHEGLIAEANLMGHEPVKAKKGKSKLRSERL